MALDREAIQLRVGLEYHLRWNHYPPVPNAGEWIDPCIAAIDACNAGESDKLIDLPSDTQDRETGASQSPAWKLVETWHLESYLVSDEDNEIAIATPVLPVQAVPQSEENLDPRFTAYYQSGERVEVTWKEGYGDWTGYGARTDGRKARFYVGKSTGQKPIYLQILRRDSSGGAAILGEGIASIRGLGIYRVRNDPRRRRNRRTR